MAERKDAAPATHTQPSRKGKKAWRKNVDISEVQQGLDHVREEIIKGGVVAEKPAEELFATDLHGDANIEQKHRPKKLLKADEILAQRSAVPGLSSGSRKRKAAEVDSPKVGKRLKHDRSYVTHRELQRLKAVADGASIGLIAAEEQASYDPWGATKQTKDKLFDFLEPSKQTKVPKSMKQAPTPLTANGKPVAHVRKPAAGKSYNPLVGDWSTLLKEEGQVAVDTEKARLAVEAAQEERDRRTIEEAEKVEEQEKDEYATDYESAWESEWDGIQSEAEQEIYTQKSKTRKTPVERNKIKARKERAARDTWEKKQKQREEELKRIKQIAKELSARDKQSRPLMQRQASNMSSDSDENAYRTILQKRRFGKLSIPDAPLEVVLPEELQDSLRRLKPEGNLLTDRYRNLLINGKLEVRKKVGQVKKKQTFNTEKWSYKDFELK